MNTTIKLPYTPKGIKTLLEKKAAFMERVSSGDDIVAEETLSDYANPKIPERIRNKYKPKG